MRVANKKIGTALSQLELQEALIEIFLGHRLDYQDNETEAVRSGAIDYWTALILSPNAVKETRNILSFALSLQQHYDDTLSKAASLFWSLYGSSVENDYVKQKSYISLLDDIAQRYETTTRQISRYLLSMHERQPSQQAKIILEFVEDQLLWGGKPLNIEPLTTKVLKMLAGKPMEVVPVTDIETTLTVNYDSLKTTMSKLRDKMGNEFFETSKNGKKAIGYKLLLSREQIVFSTVTGILPTNNEH